MIPLYLVGHLRQKLAQDPRTNLIDVQVRIVGKRVFITGTVESATLPASVEEVVREAVPAEMEVINQLCVVNYVP
jgi:hypothetical protein